ncbi:DUF6266 family protein [Pedobacter sp. GR22-6]|uniref:DUF6266 family protein n=1 Tax=Pedobacter sp. GR22-6 TaxID=3127957 RepID=UPI00307D9EE3
MGISKDGLHGKTNGKVGNLVYYERLGKNIVRTIGQNSKPASVAQLQSRQEQSVCSKMMSAVLPFIKVGYSMQIVGTDKSAFNMGMKYNRSHALSGTYPDVAVVYEKIQLSDGKLLPAQEPVVVQIAEGLEFSWLADPYMAWEESQDQVMLCAYFPENNVFSYKLFGNTRLTGRDILFLKEEEQSQYMEVYISFVAADRKSVALSTYLGNFNKP